MEKLPKNKMLKFNEDTFTAVRKAYNLDQPARMRESLDILEEWVKVQNHFLKKDFSRDYLERFLISSKGSVERAKEKLDKSCTLRQLMPQYFEPNMDAYSKCYTENVKFAVLPKLTQKHERVHFFSVLGKEFSASMFLECYKFLVMLAEYIRAHDYAIGFHLVVDYRFCSLTEAIAKFSIMDLRQIVIIMIECYSFRVKGIHLISDSKFMDYLLSIAKQVVPKKISSRIHLHKSEETLYEHIDKNMLPIEYGGQEKSLAELNAEWVETLTSTEFLEYWKEMILARTDESKRLNETFNEQYLGMPGSFRTLRVD